MRVKSFFIAAAALLVATHVSAQSAEQQVAQRVMSFYQTLNDGNAAAWAQHNSASYHGNFPREGTVFGTNQPDIAGMQQSFDSGAASYNLVVHNLDVSVYGNTAVATFYTTGPSQLASGALITGTYRVTQVWVREGNAWKVVHFHISPLET